jgi:hypothetical protein
MSGVASLRKLWAERGSAPEDGMMQRFKMGNDINL